MKIVGIDHVQLAMPRGNEDDARDFYRDILGMDEIPKPANLAARGGVWFAAGDRQLHLGSRTTFARQRRPTLRFASRISTPSGTTSPRAAMHRATTNRFPAIARFYVADPFGNRLELIEPAEIN